MAKRKEPDALEALRAIASRLPDVEAGIACKGTAAECVTCKVNKRAFLFLRPAAVMLKLKESVGDVARLAAKEPDRYNAGAGGWVTVKRPTESPLPMDVMERFIGESYRLMTATPAVKKKAPAKKKAAKKGIT
jgi:hypothetical protein